MARYELLFRKSVAKDLRAIPNRDMNKIMLRIRALAEDPRPVGCEKLSGEERYRIRQGAYRVIYEIEENRLVVLVVKIGQRRHIYRQH